MFSTSIQCVLYHYRMCSLISIECVLLSLSDVSSNAAEITHSERDDADFGEQVPAGMEGYRGVYPVATERVL